MFATAGGTTTAFGASSSAAGPTDQTIASIGEEGTIITRKQQAQGASEERYTDASITSHKGGRQVPAV